MSAPAKVKPEVQPATYTIERRYIGKLTGGLLDRWHVLWLDWHVWLDFKSKRERDKKLRAIRRDKGWHIDNFEYREGLAK